MRVSVKGSSFVRIITGVVLIACELLIACLYTFGQVEQGPGKTGAQSGQNESGTGKQVGRKPREEEEEPTKPSRKVPLRVGDEDQEANQPLSAKPIIAPPTDLEREAKQARHPAVQELFSHLAKPHDVVTLAGPRTWNVEPIPEYIGPAPKLVKALSLKVFDAEWKRVRSFSVEGNEILGVEPYEKLALRRVDEFLKSGLDRDADSKQYLPRLEMLQEADKAMGAVLLFHDSAVERGVRKGVAWDGLRKRLVARLRAVQLNELRALTNWESAWEFATRLADAYAGQKDIEVQIVSLMVRFVRESLKEENYGLTNSRLHLLEAQFPGSPELEHIHEEISTRAKKFVEEARELEGQGDFQEAKARLNKAEEIDPRLPGLKGFSSRLGKKNPVLSVCVRDLPEYLSPATAYLDSEKQAVELLFESLVKHTYSSTLGPHYEPVLADDLPRIVPLGRRFSLTRGARWSSEKLVTASDVRHTVDLLSEWPGHIQEWAELLKGGARIGTDSFHISLTLHQGYVDPLSLMDFKILPDFVQRADDPAFAKAPVGSGPYQRQKRDGEVVFVANPFYETRPGKSGLPWIREIHFVRSDNPVEEFQQGRFQLLLDLPTSSFKALGSVSRQDTILKTLPNRRIYFLAINHRRSLLANENLRRAISSAINRETILNDCFRAGLTPRPHRALNGPYPPGSWACNPDLPGDLYKPELAQTQAKKAKESGAVGKLTLKYPTGDSAVANACEAIRKYVSAAGIELELRPLESRQLRRDVEERPDYDLAYYSWDYPDETFWLWPLLDPDSQALRPGGRNLLGYKGDALLETRFRQAMSHRDPVEVKMITHKIHQAFNDKMPFIPLWQLDTHLAVHQSLSMVDGQGRPVEVDPLLIFTSVETWRLENP
jgi:ABC-type transport system substrate-binding protein